MRAVDISLAFLKLPKICISQAHETIVPKEAKEAVMRLRSRLYFSTVQMNHNLIPLLN